MNERNAPRPRAGLAVLVPAVAFAFFATDVALHFTPLDPFAFRAWEPMRRHPPPGASFAASRTYANDRAYGELAAMSNRPSMRHVRRETFTTDAFGFRNAPDLLAAGPPDVVLFGDSFAAGCGVCDDETLSSDLGRITGRRVYNAAGAQNSAASIRATVDRLRMTSGVVLLEYHERHGGPPPESKQGTCALTFPPIERLQQASRIRILSESAHKWIADDVILPNPLCDRAPALKLRNGETMLFLADEIEWRDVDVRDELYGNEIVSIARATATTGLRVVVVLVPSKFTVYGPLLAKAAGAPETIGARIKTAERIVRSAGVEVLCLTDEFQRAAEDGLARGGYIYRIDDTHWSPEGIQLAAKRVADLLERRK